MADRAARRRILQALGQAAKTWARPRIRSYKGKPIRALQKALRVQIVGPDEVQLQIPHFWAVYVHDGREAPVRPQVATFMIWWENPREDPRLRPTGVTPQRASQIRHLTADEFREALATFRSYTAAGFKSPVIVRRHVTKPTPPSPFFSNEVGGGMHGFVKKANEVGGVEARREILGLLKKELGFSGFVPHPGEGVNFGLIKDEASTG